jgi:hypothetical protein
MPSSCSAQPRIGCATPGKVGVAMTKLSVVGCSLLLVVVIALLAISAYFVEQAGFGVVMVRLVIAGILAVFFCLVSRAVLDMD